MIKNFSKWLLIATLIFITAFLAFAVTVSASEGEVELHFFWAKGCPFCEEQKVFLEDLRDKYPDLRINDYSISEQSSIDLLKGFIEKNPDAERYLGSVPMTFIGNNFFVGFNQEIGQRIENAVIRELSGNDNSKEEDSFSLPIIGDINVQDWSLGALAITIGIIDGFNVCSLGALVLILSLVFTLKSRKMILLFGGLFILITVVVYGLLVFMWHQLFSVLGPHLLAMRVFIGLASFLGGIYFIKQFLKFRKEGPVCESAENKIISNATKKIEESFKSKKGILSLLGGVIAFATIVTIVEFPCSAVFPVIFAGILSQADLSLGMSLFYIGMYLFFYMLDELVIFLVAVFTQKIWITSGPFMTIISIIGAAILFYLSFYYLFVL